MVLGARAPLRAAPLMESARFDCSSGLCTTLVSLVSVGGGSHNCCDRENLSGTLAKIVWIFFPKVTNFFNFAAYLTPSSGTRRTASTLCPDNGRTGRYRGLSLRTTTCTARISAKFEADNYMRR